MNMLCTGELSELISSDNSVICALFNAVVVGISGSSISLYSHRCVIVFVVYTYIEYLKYKRHNFI